MALFDLSGIAIPLGTIAVGGVVMAVSGGRWPGLLAGGVIIGGGLYLATRELEGEPSVEREYQIEPAAASVEIWSPRG